MDQIPCETCGWDADTRSSPVQLKTPTHILLQWVRDNTLAALTILGILVYVIFSVPTTYFYARLGTTPSEVGVTYATIVSGSTFGLLLIAGLLAIALYYLFISLLLVAAYLTGVGIILALAADPKLFRRDRSLTDEQFEKSCESLRKLFMEVMIAGKK